MLSSVLAAVLAVHAGDPAPAPPAAAAPPSADRAAPERSSAPGKPDRAPVAEKKPIPTAAVLQDVVGTVRSVDRERHRISVDTSSGATELQLDRNTLVYVSRGLGTILDVLPGARVRAGRNADALAYWVAVQTPQPDRPASQTTGQGSGVTRGAGPPPSESGAPPGPGGGLPPSPGSVTGPAGTR